MKNCSKCGLLKPTAEFRVRKLNEEFTHQDVSVVRERFGHQCFNCGSCHKLSLDNAVLLCQSCNAAKYNLTH